VSGRFRLQRDNPIKHPILPPRLAELHAALKEEERAEREALAHWETCSLDERIAAGVAFPLLMVEEGYWAGRQFRIVARAPKGVWLHDGIDGGDSVAVTVGGQVLSGRCRGNDGRVVDITVSEPVESGTSIDVGLRADPSTWVRYRQALERASELDTPLVHALLSAEVDEGEQEGATLAGLNASQVAAADHALRANALAAIHGPPGTGKTRVIGAMLVELVRRGDTPWALADSNAAVDHLALTAHKLGLNVVRLGAVSRIHPDVEALSLDSRLKTGPFAAALAALNRDISRTTDHWERRRLTQQRRGVADQAQDHVLQGADVIACTFGSLGRWASSLPTAHTAVVDEATQATEPAVWVAVPWVQRLIVVGDPEQLGPVTRVAGSALETSVLERLMIAGLEAPMLSVQHRMDGRIRALVSQVYGPTYVDHPSVSVQPLSGLSSVTSAPLTDMPTWFIDTAGSGLGERLDTATRSLANPGEAQLVSLLVDELVALGVARSSIAVIAPYSAQVARLRQVLPGVEVATVNAYQGRERDVIIVSWVRSNTDGDLGFVADPRRLTVSLTRARRALLQIGDSATLCSHPRFAALVDGIAAAGGLASVFEPPWDMVLSI
jgi:ATP-dependent RNA/DNA helicase IGHMBP2